MITNINNMITYVDHLGRLRLDLWHHGICESLYVVGSAALDWHGTVEEAQLWLNDNLHNAHHVFALEVVNTDPNLQNQYPIDDDDDAA